MNPQALHQADAAYGRAGPADLESLARLACAGDRAAFDAAAEMLRPRLVATLRQKLRSLADAEDVAQAALWRWWERRGRYDPRRPFVPWLMTVALRLATDTQRAGARRARHEHAAGDARPPDPSSPSRHAEARELRDTVWATARSVLGPDTATALWLFYGEQMTPREIADVLGKRSGAVRVMLHRGRAALRPHLGALAPSPDAPASTIPAPAADPRPADPHAIGARP